MNPLFKWAGGKKKMLAKYEKDVFEPSELRCEVFVDMFAGAGTMSLWAYLNRERLGLKRIILNDINDELIHMYRVMKEDVSGFIGTCMELETVYFKGKEKQYRKDVYLCWRDEYADGEPDPLRKASLLFCMLKTNFNGIWQSRARDGIYYTPFGNGNEKDQIIYPEEIHTFKAMLDMAEITCKSFEDVDCLPEEYENAFFYADPPYLSSFTKYKKKKGETNFGEEETGKLIGILHDKGMAGAKFALSNKQHDIFNGREGIVIFRDIKYTASSRDTERAVSDEILWTNLSYGAD